MKIAFFGLGGVGGYFAAQMADYYKDRPDMEFYFIARGKHLLAIREKGLTLRRESHPPITVYPKRATENPAECPVMDYVIYSTKSYSVDSSMEQLRRLCDNRTVLIPFLNGVDGYPKLKAGLPESEVANGCVYIFSKIEEPGTILCTSKGAQYFVGSESGDRRVKDFCKLAEQAVDRVVYADDVESRVWKKFARISVFATVTTHHNLTNVQLKTNPAYQDEFRSLSDEFCEVAYAMGKLPEFSKEVMFQDNLTMVNNSADSATSSMQRDYWAGKESELDSLTGYISQMGKIYGIKTPTYDQVYRDLKR